jgi:peptide deformylase
MIGVKGFFMSVLNLVYFPDDPLTQKANPVEAFDKKLESLAADMLETMHLKQGVGLAGPQIGLSKRIFVLQEPEGEEMILINPEIITMEGKESAEEGCLSMPQIYADVPRATRIEVKAQDLTGEWREFEAANFLARIIQHEYDHLDGILFPERLDIITRQEKLTQWAEVREKMMSEGV